MTSDTNVPIRIGLIGCGRGTNLIHLPILANHRCFHVTAVADTDPARLETVGNRFAVEHRFEDALELIGHDDIEAVAVVTPPDSHAALGCATLAAGKHLFVEKPLAMTVAECDQLAEQAATSPGKILVGLNFRWHRLIHQARDQVRSGALGQLKAIRSVYTHWHPGSTAQPWHRERRPGGGVIFNDGVHHFDLWQYLLDCPVATVHVVSRASADFEDDTASVVAEMAGGVLASGVFCFSTSPNSELEIYGDRGRLFISCYEFDGLEFVPTAGYPGGLRRRLRRLGASFGSLRGALANARRGGDFTATHHHMWQHFADCIQHGETPACTLEDGRHALLVALAAIQSTRSGCPVTVGHGDQQGCPDPASYSSANG